MFSLGMFGLGMFGYMVTVAVGRRVLTLFSLGMFSLGMFGLGWSESAHVNCICTCMHTCICI